MQADIDALVSDLAHSTVASDTFNQYASPDPDNSTRRHNLRLYLRSLAEREREVMLVMEAPGYRGCRLTGVPVTSRRLLREGVPGVNWFGLAKGYQDPADVSFERVQGEQTATIVWGALAALGVIPVVWNTFPFHPHRPAQPMTNRPPRRPEIEQGRAFLDRIVALYQPHTVIAVGRVADAALTTSDIIHQTVRHPAQGGKNDFVAGLNAILA